MGAQTLVADARILISLLRGLPRRGAHVERLERFYGPQAGRYDDFRERLLKGRAELIRRLPVQPGDRIVELGGGTGRNLEFFGPALAALESIEVVDLCRPLLDIAAARTTGLSNVRLTQADATTWRPAAPVDGVYFSYALTMIPDWRAAIRNALAMLKPGGFLASVDFYVSSARPLPGMARHGWLARTLWPAWFRHDGVGLSPDPLDLLQLQLETIHIGEHRGPLPYLPCCHVPYYLYVGRKAGG